MKVQFNAERVEWEYLIDDMAESDHFSLDFIDEVKSAFSENNEDIIVKFFTEVQYMCNKFDGEELEDFNGYGNYLLRIMRLWLEMMEDDNLIFGDENSNLAIILESFNVMSEKLLDSQEDSDYFRYYLELCFRQWTYLLRNTTGVKIVYKN